MCPRWGKPQWTGARAAESESLLKPFRGVHHTLILSNPNDLACFGEAYYFVVLTTCVQSVSKNRRRACPPSKANRRSLGSTIVEMESEILADPIGAGRAIAEQWRAAGDQDGAQTMDVALDVLSGWLDERSTPRSTTR